MNKEIIINQWIDNHHHQHHNRCRKEFVETAEVRNFKNSLAPSVTALQGSERKVMTQFQGWIGCVILALVFFRSGSKLECTMAIGVVDIDGDTWNGNGKTPGWYPKDDHPCTIERVSMKDFLEEYGTAGGLPPLFPRPLVITTDAIGNNNIYDQSNNRRNLGFWNLTRAGSILDAFPANFSVTLSSSNSFSEHRRTVPFATYLEEVGNGPALNADAKSNETWYLFGETFSPEWKRLLNHYALPPCQACNSLDESMIALSFGIGNSGSGVQWHVHGPGFSETVHGRKHWVMYPLDKEPSFSPDQTSLNWMHYNYAALKKLEDLPLECTLHPGDLIYFPNMWWHATINIDDYTAFVSTFTQEHVFAEMLKTTKSWE